MVRNKDDDKDEAVACSATVVNSNNTNKAIPISPNNEASNVTPGTGPVRTTGRVKKPKQVYDPSDNYISRVSRNSLPAPSTQSTPEQPVATLNNIVPKIEAANDDVVPSTTGIKTEEPDDGVALSFSQFELKHHLDTCMKCRKSEPKRGSGYKSNFLTCKACSMKWHFDCVPIQFEILTNARKRYKCERCRRCNGCLTGRSSSSPREMVVCCVCVNAYHLPCHWPRIPRSKLTDPKWRCSNCDCDYGPNQFDGESTSPPRKGKAGRKKRNNSDPSAATNGSKKPCAKQLGVIKLEPEDENKPGSSSSNTSNSSVVLIHEVEDKKIKVERPTSPTDSLPLASLSLAVLGIEREETKPVLTVAGPGTVHSWSVDQVVRYVKRLYPHEAEVFRAQEIDGGALMVLTRQDIIDRFGLKLGPALRVYELVLAMQTGIDDITLAWND
ncbi:CG2662 [Drosophila busckii]|uniref:CG2662 n=1 Tax=Drosophila busckii TaxID=30019 RepID=A0A0M4F9C1_DROBS|nr:uncharacterized protein LOC108605460 [Drosophila busckii]ALC48782.1 CG2662 [Drosophila busckii]